MSAPKKVTLGKVYRDTISGFTGTATARAEYLHSTPDVRIEADSGPTGDAKERWVREARLEPASARSTGFGS
jgi:hypothetical protein